MNQNYILVACAKCGTKNRIPQNRVEDNPICGKCKQPLVADNFPSTPVDITDQSFNEEVFTFGGPVLVDCWAPWCGPRRTVAPILEQLASEYAGRVKIAKLNVDQNPLTASKYGIQSIPTMLIFKSGKQVDSIVGALPKQEIERYISKVI